MQCYLQANAARVAEDANAQGSELEYKHLLDMQEAVEECEGKLQQDLNHVCVVFYHVANHAVDIAVTYACRVQAIIQRVRLFKQAEAASVTKTDATAHLAALRLKAHRCWADSVAAAVAAAAVAAAAVAAAAVTSLEAVNCRKVAKVAAAECNGQRYNMP